MKLKLQHLCSPASHKAGVGGKEGIFACVTDLRLLESLVFITSEGFFHFDGEDMICI